MLLVIFVDLLRRSRLRSSERPPVAFAAKLAHDLTFRRCESTALAVQRLSKLKLCLCLLLARSVVRQGAMSVQKLNYYANEVAAGPAKVRWLQSTLRQARFTSFEAAQANRSRCDGGPQRQSAESRGLLRSSRMHRVGR